MKLYVNNFIQVSAFAPRGNDHAKSVLYSIREPYNTSRVHKI